MLQKPTALLRVVQTGLHALPAVVGQRPAERADAISRQAVGGRPIEKLLTAIVTALQSLDELLLAASQRAQRLVITFDQEAALFVKHIQDCGLDVGQFR